MDNFIEVLDRGYVRLVDSMGSDLSVVNAARCSYAKESTEFSDKDKGLLKFLIRNQHMSPFRHAFMTFEVKAPLMVCRQWWKYVVGSDHTLDSWNEASRRYITMEPEFYIPTKWRSKPENSKQGSGEDVDDFSAMMLTDHMLQAVEDGMARYNYALDKGVAPEQARGFLPAYFMYTMWRWSCSLQSATYFLSQRLEDDAQFEIRKYAQAVKQLIEPIYPVTLGEL